MLGRSNAYYGSVLYKMVFILSGFREACGLTGQGFIDNLRVFWSNQGKFLSFAETNFMTMVDSGCVELNEDEVKIYSDYISMNYGVPFKNRDEFYENLAKYVADEIPSLENLLPYKKAMLKVKAISQLMDMI